MLQPLKDAGQLISNLVEQQARKKHNTDDDLSLESNDDSDVDDDIQLTKTKSPNLQKRTLLRRAQQDLPF